MFPFVNTEAPSESALAKGQQSFRRTQEGMKGRYELVTEREKARTAKDMNQLALQMAEANLLHRKKELDWFDTAQQAEINYKTAIGNAAGINALMGELNYNLAKEKFPLEMEALRYELDMMKNYFSGESSGNGGTSNNGRPNIPHVRSNAGGKGSFQTGMPPLEGMGSHEQFNQETETATATENAEPIKITPDDYLKPEKEYKANQPKMVEKYVPSAELEYQKSEAINQAKRREEGYAKLVQEAGEKAAIAAEENPALDAMQITYGKIPEWQKGPIMGELKAFTGAAQVYQALHSGVTMNALGLQVGTASEEDRKTLQQIYGGRYLTDAAIKEVLTIRRIFNDRLIKKQEFVAAHSDLSRENIEQAWNAWLSDNSYLDAERYKNFLAERRAGMTVKDAKADEAMELRGAADRAEAIMKRRQGGR